MVSRKIRRGSEPNSGRVERFAAAAVFRRGAHAERAGWDGRLVWSEQENIRSRPFCARLYGRSDPRDELRLAAVGGIGCKAGADSRHGRRGEIENLAADYGGRF